MKKFLTGLLLLIGQFAIAQTTGNIKGKVTTSEGEAIPMATISLKGVSGGATADEDGFFILKNIKEGTYTLSATFTGLAAREAQVTVTAGKTLELELALDASNT